MIEIEIAWEEYRRQCSNQVVLENCGLDVAAPAEHEAQLELVERAKARYLALLPEKQKAPEIGGLVDRRSYTGTVRPTESSRVIRQRFRFH